MIVIGILQALLGLFLIISLRMVTTFFHEMGHAIPALLFTKKKVNVYVGSYGDDAGTFKMHLGRLIMYIKFNLFSWQIGLCRQEESAKKTWQKFIIVLGGPIASLLIAIPLILNLKNLESHPSLNFLAIVFMVAATIDLITNLIPRVIPMALDDGNIAYNDGYIIRSLIREQFLPKEYHQLSDLYEAKEYQKIIKTCEALKNEKKNPARYIYDFKIASHDKLKQHQLALDEYVQLYQNNKISKSDYNHIGSLYQELGDHHQALEYFSYLQHYSYQDIELLNNMAVSYMAIGNNRKAVELLNAAIYNQPKYLKSYKHRAQAYDKLWEHELAQKDKDFYKEHNKTPNKAPEEKS